MALLSRCFLIGVKLWFISVYSKPLEDCSLSDKKKKDCSLKVVKLWFVSDFSEALEDLGNEGLIDNDLELENGLAQTKGSVLETSGALNTGIHHKHFQFSYTCCISLRAAVNLQHKLCNSRIVSNDRDHRHQLAVKSTTVDLVMIGMRQRFKFFSIFLFLLIVIVFPFHLLIFKMYTVDYAYYSCLFLRFLGTTWAFIFVRL